MKRFICAKFSSSGPIYAFTGDDPFLTAGDAIIVEGEQGPELARIITFIEHLPKDMESDPVRAMLRRATDEDIDVDESNRQLAASARSFCDARVRERALDMKLVDVECLFDRSKLIFFFTAPTRIDFRDLVKDLVREYHTRIELRQIGVRHETQMLGALGSCGMTCCCRRFLRKFMPVTIKMAKEQNLFLNPTKISGICGRLLCCLSYEQENYDLFHRSCPRLGKRYQTRQGSMKVLRANMFRNSVAVLTDQGEELEFTLEEWKELDPRRPEAPPRVDDKAESKQDRPAQAPVRPVHTPNELMVVVADPASLDDVDNVFDAVLPQEDDTLPTTNAQHDEPNAAHTQRHRRKRKK